MMNVDKRDAAQRAIDFLREKNIKLKRAEALELLAQLSGAPNWNVLQAAMHAPAASRHPVAVAVEPAPTPEFAISLEAPAYTPPAEAVFWGGHAFWHYERIEAEAPRFCREIQAQAELAKDSHKAAVWGHLARDFETHSRMSKEFFGWTDFKKRNNAPPEVRQAARAWLKTIQEIAKPVLECLDEEIAENKAKRGVWPILSETRRLLYSELKSICRFAEGSLRRIAERENYDRRIVYLGHIEALMSNVLAVEGEYAANWVREACRAAQEAAQAALLLKNNVSKLTR